MMPVLGIWTKAAWKRSLAFGQDESGIMAPHIIVFLFLMMVVGGIAVDVMRFETRRVAVQNTLDRASLAAASLEQKRDPVTVVRDYFSRAGLISDLQNVSLNEGMNYRIVEASATVSSKNYFMSMLNINQLRAISNSVAEQRVTNVEIALVLDVSGSMEAKPNRIRDLKVAAKEFVDTVLANDVDNLISISLVPYNGQVNLGPALFQKFNATHRHAKANSFCLDLPASTFKSSTLSRSTPLPQSPLIDGFSTPNISNYWQITQAPNWDQSRKLWPNAFCNPVAGNYVRIHSNDKAALKRHIDGLVAIGATSMDLGMKWGTLLLDPSAHDIVADLGSADANSADFSGRPAPYSDRETMKVIVLMTDGANFEQERTGDDYRVGPSPIFRSDSGKWSIHHSTAPNSCRPYWVPETSSWHSRPYNGERNYSSNSDCVDPKITSWSKVTRQDWTQVWDAARSQWVAWQLYARALGNNTSSRNTHFNTWKNNFARYLDTTEVDRRMKDICDTAKSNGIAIYGIAFEALPEGRRAIRNCVSEPASNFYFDVDGLEIRTAFALIASNLSQLRLTQ